MRGQRTIRLLMLSAAGITLGACLDTDATAVGLPCAERWREAPAPAHAAAWLAVVAACQRGPACPVERSCSDSRWPWLADAVLEDMVPCFVGPCEGRAPCLADFMPVSCPPPAATLEVLGDEGTS